MAPIIHLERQASLLAVVTAVGLAFAACSSDGSATAAAIAPSGVHGQVHLQSCPISSSSGCGERGIAARIEAVRHGASNPVGRVQATSDGHFRLGLAPGRYLLKAISSHAAGCHPAEVTVPRRKWISVTIICSRGIA